MVASIGNATGAAVESSERHGRLGATDCAGVDFAADDRPALRHRGRAKGRRGGETDVEGQRGGDREDEVFMGGMVAVCRAKRVQKLCRGGSL